jgi:hypothetical protein
MRQGIHSKSKFLPLAVALIVIACLFGFRALAEDDEDFEDQTDSRTPAVVQPTENNTVQTAPADQAIIQEKQISSTTEIDKQADNTNKASSITKPQNQTVPVLKANPAADSALRRLIDTDYDGVPDVSDNHPGEDDFAFRLKDNNLNGIADELESILP